MQKMGGGTSTLGRKNWKRRWMTLKGGELHYHPSQEEDATVLGIVDIQSATDFVEGVPGREFGFQIVTPSRTYPMSTDTAEEQAEWMDLLRSVRGKSKEEIQTLLDNARVNPRNAEVCAAASYFFLSSRPQSTLEVEDILSVGPTHRVDNDGRPEFAVLCPDRVEKFVAYDQEDMDDWIRVLSPKRKAPGEGGSSDEEGLVRGWMWKFGGKAGTFKRKRWFVLRGDVVSYYKHKVSASNDLRACIRAHRP